MTVVIVVVEIKLLICQVTSREHMIKGLCEFMGGTPTHKSSLCLKDQVTSQKHLIEERCNFKSEGASWYITHHLPSLVAKDIVVREVRS